MCRTKNGKPVEWQSEFHYRGSCRWQCRDLTDDTAGLRPFHHQLFQSNFKEMVNTLTYNS